MKRLSILTSAMIVFGSGQAAQAQYNGGFQGVNPIITVRQPGGPLNYFTQAQPQYQYASQIKALQQANANTMEYTTGTTSLDATGHASGFQTHLRYFANLGGVRPTSAGGGLANPLGNQLTNQGATKPAPGGR